MDLEHFPPNFIDQLKFKFFSTNIRSQNLPDLWCVCSKHINPQILTITDQIVAFSWTWDNMTIYLATIYAYNFHHKWKTSWSNLTNLQNNHNHSWCLIGDFNAILGVHDHQGRLPPSKASIIEFQEWVNHNFLVDMTSKGSFYTWSNGRQGAPHVERKLDKIFCNHSWITPCNSSIITTLPRPRSGNFPISMEAVFNIIKFKSYFRFLSM